MMMCRPKIKAIKLVRFSDDYGGKPVFEIFYEDGTSESFDDVDFDIFPDGRFVENVHS